MSIHCFTSISLNYLAKARVLGNSVKRFHPDWIFTLCITDRAPAGFAFDVASEPFDHIVWTEEQLVEATRAWMFQHDVVELCTAVKGLFMKSLTDTAAEKIFYLDPDTAVFASLDPLVAILDHDSIVLTPHQLTPEHEAGAIIDNEMCSLAFGTYNLGFIGIRNDAEGKRFAQWWNDRLIRYCVDDRPSGLFVDQKWCDLVPALFDRVKILRDPGYNVASWNLSNRQIRIDRSGNITVNGMPLRFFHFTKLGPIADTMTIKYARDNVEVYELWSWYKRAVEKCVEPTVPPGWWHFATFSNNVPIPASARRLYRARADLRRDFDDPFNASGSSFYAWLVANGRM
jgi:hypothetical protein